jgi:hypothetical protein
MKKLSVAIAVAIAIGVSTSHAQVLAFPVKVTGVIIFDGGGPKPTKVVVTGALLTSNLTDSVILVVDLDNHQLRVQEVDASTNVVQTLMSSRRLAVLSDRSFTAGTQFDFTLPALAGGFEVDGDIQISGKISPATGTAKKINATLVGVLNDSVDGAGTTTDTIVKGKVISAGNVFDGGPFDL